MSRSDPVERAAYFKAYRARNLEKIRAYNRAWMGAKRAVERGVLSYGPALVPVSAPGWGWRPL